MEKFDKIIISARHSESGTEYKISIDGNVSYFTIDDLELLECMSLSASVNVLSLIHKKFCYETKSKS